MTPKKSIETILTQEHSPEGQPDIFNKEGNIRFVYSFQFQLIKSALLSLFLTALTILALLSLTFLMFYASKKTAENKNKIPSYGSSHYSEMMENYLDQDPLEKHFPSARSLAEKQQLKKLFLLFFVMAFCSIALFITYFLIITRRFSGCLAEITSGINKISDGDFEYRIPVRKKDEFGLIAGCINEMSRQIQENIAKKQQTELEKNQLITSVAHDIRTPLTSILGYLELLCHTERELSASERREYLRIAYEKSRRLMTLTEDLFTYTKVSFGELSIKPQPFDLILFMEQMLEEFYPALIDNHLTCRFSHPMDTLIVNGDNSMLARVFSNLLSNAIKYGKDGKQLFLSVDVLSGFAVIKITNYGMVIPEESLEHIFERFYRVEGSRSLDTGGSGLGLSIAQKIVLLHNGTIVAKSSQEGTSFIVTLPLQAEL